MIFPNRCSCCRKVIKWDLQMCNECRAKLPFVEELPWQGLFPEKIGDSPVAFDNAFVGFWYHYPIIGGVLRLKLGRGRKFAYFSADLLTDKLENEEISADLITAVPMRPIKKVIRGYNQAELIASRLSKNLDIPTNFKILMRKRTTFAQHSLNQENRYKYAENAYASMSGHADIRGMKIIICDDVFTTGATMNKCVRLLKELGAEEVYVAVICKT